VVGPRPHGCALPCAHESVTEKDGAKAIAFQHKSKAGPLGYSKNRPSANRPDFVRFNPIWADSATKLYAFETTWRESEAIASDFTPKLNDARFCCLT
jgi:hypothetical protein